MATQMNSKNRLLSVVKRIAGPPDWSTVRTAPMPVAPNTVKNNLNTGIGSVNLFIGNADAPATGGVQDRLAAHAEASGHGGDFRKNVQGGERHLGRSYQSPERRYGIYGPHVPKAWHHEKMILPIGQRHGGS
jgi:hypothetical protein